MAPMKSMSGEGFAAARKADASPVLQAEVERIIRSVMSDMDAESARLYSELAALARYIQQARFEIAALRPGEIRTKDIPSATDELDAVIGATERATGQIIDACEQIEALSTKLAQDQAPILVEAVTHIYEACGFQDITGQRITKVVKTLKHIEDKVNRLLEVFGDELARSETIPELLAETSQDKAGDAALLNGPQLPGQGVDQAEIDRLLASFD